MAVPVTNEDHGTRTECKQTKGTVGSGSVTVPVLLKGQSGKVKLAVGCADLERGAKAGSESVAPGRSFGDRKTAKKRWRQRGGGEESGAPCHGSQGR